MDGLGGSMWVMSEWLVSQWILDVMRFQKIFGLYGVERHKVSWIFEKPNLPQNMRVILSAFDNFEFDTSDRLFWYTLTQGFPKIYHTYGVSWIFEKPNLPQNMGVIRLSAFDNFEFDNRDVLLYPMMHNVLGLTWFWVDLKALAWK